ncbi:MAG: hypothetical protein ABS35_33545 [Kaistia sp. SCN 65-12]|nr:MAG: hypothetical protein ABS35_33545 [Kaistia sp. SCN 65-12]
MEAFDSRVRDCPVRASGPKLLPHVPEALASFRAAGLRTGNSIGRSRMKLEGAGLDPALIDWEVSFISARARLRSDLTYAARDRLSDTPCC